nr:hypothetical protein [Microbacterium testaceum]
MTLTKTPDAVASGVFVVLGLIGGRMPRLRRQGPFAPVFGRRRRQATADARRLASMARA